MAKFGLVGDIHGRMGWLRRAFEAFAAEGGVDAVLLAGETGIDWPVSEIGPTARGDVAEQLAVEHGTPIIFAPGNHDNRVSLLAVPVEPEEYQKIRPHVWMLHGKIKTSRGIRIAALGGASSIDEAGRRRYEAETGTKTWWPEELVDRQLAR